MRIQPLFLSLVLAIGLTGCNGTSGENGDDPFANDNATPPLAGVSIQLTLLDSQCQSVNNNSFALGEQLCIRALVSENGRAKGGEIVNFSAGLGGLSSASKLTASQGIAEVKLNSTDSTAGAATLTASVGEASAQLNYEFLAADVVNPAIPQVILRMLDDDNSPINRFKVGDKAKLQATVTDAAQQPLSDVIVRFQAERGELQATDALSQEKGIAEVLLTAGDDDLGAAEATAQFSVDDKTYITRLNYEVLAADAVDNQVIKFGHFASNGAFIDNQIGSSLDEALSAGGSLGLNVAVVTEQNGQIQRLLSPTLVTFTSICAQNGDAKVDEQITTVNGEASTTYEDIRCAGNTDIVSAAITLNSTVLTISKNIQIQPESVGSIAFVSADPDNIVLQGTGGQNNVSVSTVTFQVNGALGNPLAQQQVDFALNTKTGGLSLSPATGRTNSLGQVSTRVSAGNVPTASMKLEDNTQINTQSDLLTVNTGLPDQNSMTLSFSDLNPEAFDISGQRVTVTASLADTFNNPVPDGTAVAFTAEGGSIEPRCTTISGLCSVIWTSANPRPIDHRVTILATAVGHETLLDSNGNNVYDDQDGDAITDNDGSGFKQSTPSRSGFVDLAEAWRDDNENGSRDINEIFLDFDADGDYDLGNQQFDGPQCTHASKCGANSLHVRKAQVLVMSSSEAVLNLYDGASMADLAPLTSIARGSSATYRLEFADTAGQPIASGSTIRITTSAGTLAGNTGFTMPMTNKADKGELDFVLTNELASGAPSVTATIEILVTSPREIESSLVLPVALL